MASKRQGIVLGFDRGRKGMKPLIYQTKNGVSNEK
jgi:hypothetical protein